MKISRLIINVKLFYNIDSPFRLDQSYIIILVIASIYLQIATCLTNPTQEKNSRFRIIEK